MRTASLFPEVLTANLHFFSFFFFCADTTYQVTFKTGDRPNAGTTAKVQFELFGDKGKTEAIQLSEDRSLRLFERGNSDKFKVDTRDVGKVCSEFKACS